MEPRLQNDTLPESLDSTDLLNENNNEFTSSENDESENSDSDSDYIPENSCNNYPEFIPHKRKRLDSSSWNEPVETKVQYDNKFMKYESDLQKCKTDIRCIELRLNTHVDEFLFKDKNNYIERLRNENNQLKFYFSCYKLLSFLEFIALFIVLYERYTGTKIIKLVCNMFQSCEITRRSLYI